jgi:hypothetical protein
MYICTQASELCSIWLVNRHLELQEHGGQHNRNLLPDTTHIVCTSDAEDYDRHAEVMVDCALKASGAHTGAGAALPAHGSQGTATLGTADTGSQRVAGAVHSLPKQTCELMWFGPELLYAWANCASLTPALKGLPCGGRHTTHCQKTASASACHSPAASYCHSAAGAPCLQQRAPVWPCCRRASAGAGARRDACGLRCLGVLCFAPSSTTSRGLLRSTSVRKCIACLA